MMIIEVKLKAHFKVDRLSSDKSIRAIDYHKQ